MDANDFALTALIAGQSQQLQRAPTSEQQLERELLQTAFHTQ